MTLSRALLGPGLLALLAILLGVLLWWLQPNVRRPDPPAATPVLIVILTPTAPPTPLAVEAGPATTRTMRPSMTPLERLPMVAASSPTVTMVPTWTPTAEPTPTIERSPVQRG